MFKFDLDQVVYYILDNKFHSAPIMSRMIVENAHEEWCSTTQQKSTWSPYGPSTKKYTTVHGSEFTEDMLFESKQALADNLINNC